MQDIAILTGATVVSEDTAVSYTHLDVYKRQDINGKLLKTSFDIIKNNQSIDLSWLSMSGIYFLKLKSTKNTVILKVILVK